MENKSFNYLALYNADYNKIMENLKAIAEASREIIEFLEGHSSGHYSVGIVNSFV